MRSSHEDVRQWIAAAKRCDAGAIAQLLDRVYPDVSATVHAELAKSFRKGRPWLDALFSTGDIVHDLALHVMRGLRGFDGEDLPSLQRYLSRAVTNQLIDTMRYHLAARRDPRRIDPNASNDDARVSAERDGPQQLAELDDEIERIHKTLATLTPLERRLILLRLQDGVRFKDIAEILDLPSPDAARKALRRARARLLVRLNQS